MSSWDGHFQEGDGWVTHRDDDGVFAFTMWVHEPTHQCVVVHRTARRSWIGAVWGAEPEDKENALGFSVTCTVRDEGGEPVSGDGFWIASFGYALKLANKYRDSVLSQRYQPSTMTQLTLDAALGERAK